MAVIKSDPKHRNIMGYIFTAVILAVWAAIHWGMPYLQRTLDAKTPADALSLMITVIRILFLALLLVALYFLRFGLRIFKFNQWPLPGARVLRDMEVLSGRPARRKAWIAVIAAAFIGLFALLGFFYLPYELNRFLSPSRM